MFKPIIYIELVEQWCQSFEYSGNDVLRILEKLGYIGFLPSDGLHRIYEIKHDDERYNYFFFHKDKHLNLINTLQQKEN